MNRSNAPTVSAYPRATAAQVRRAIIAGANLGVPALHGTTEAGGLLSATGALKALDARYRASSRSSSATP